MGFGRRNGVQCHRGNVADRISLPGPPRSKKKPEFFSSSSRPPGLLLGRPPGQDSLDTRAKKPSAEKLRCSQGTSRAGCGILSLRRLRAAHRLLPL